MSEQMMTPQQVAEYLGVDAKTVRRLAHQKNGIKAYKVGRLLRFYPADVRAYVSAQEIKFAEKTDVLPGMTRFRYKPGMKVV